jgi:hypothetical protein
MRAIVALLILFASWSAPAQDANPGRLAGDWKFNLSWGGLVEDSGTISARMAGNAIEMTCTKGCNTRAFLRGSPQGGAIVWEFWPEAGVQSKCAEDKGWRPVMPVISPDGRRIDFWYILHVSGNCGQLMKGAPAKYALTRD